MKVRVFGEPVPQGSLRTFTRRRTDGSSYTNTVGDNPRTKPWRQAIVDAWRGALESGDWDGMPVNGATVPMHVTVVFLMPRPAGHYGAGRNIASLRPSAPLWPDRRPDLDKLCRAVLDALKAAGAWRDDCLVCGLHATKIYAGPDEAPGAVIEVTPYG